MINIPAILGGQCKYQLECCHFGYQCIGLIVVNPFLLFITLDDQSCLVACGCVRIDFSLVDPLASNWFFHWYVSYWHLGSTTFGHNVKCVILNQYLPLLMHGFLLLSCLWIFKYSLVGEQFTLIDWYRFSDSKCQKCRCKAFLRRQVTSFFMSLAHNHLVRFQTCFAACLHIDVVMTICQIIKSALQFCRFIDFYPAA